MRRDDRAGTCHPGRVEDDPILLLIHFEHVDRNPFGFLAAAGALFLIDASGVISQPEALGRLNCQPSCRFDARFSTVWKNVSIT
jgi:hypothetical protein